LDLPVYSVHCCLRHEQEKTYARHFGLIGQRLCMIRKAFQDEFAKAFEMQYSCIHRLETNKLRNVAKFFSHLLMTDALPWDVLSIIHLNQEETTSSSRIFIKILCLVRNADDLAGGSLA
jgi:pre-mRNA-splicing factor CWC22